MFIIDGKNGGEYTVVKMELTEKERAKARGLGLIEGKKIVVLKKYVFGGVIAETDGIKIGLGREISRRIEVKATEK